MTMDISQSVDQTDLAWSAELMARSNPWDALFFSVEQCAEKLSDKSLTLEIAYEGGTRVAFLATSANGVGSEPTIDYIAVVEERRSHGIGTALIRHFESELFPDEDNLYIFVSDINPRALNLYVSLGFQQVGALPNFNLMGQTEFLLRKSRRPRQEVFCQGA